MPGSELLLINPRRSRKRRKNPRRARARKRRMNPRRHRAVIAAPVRRRRKNPRYRHRAYKRRHNPRRHRNPLSIDGVSSVIMPAGVGALGGVGLDIAYGYLGNYLPASLQTGIAASAVKIAGAFGLGMVAGKVIGREKGRYVTMGAVTVQLYGLVKGLLAQSAPSLPGLSGLGAYMIPAGPHGMGALRANPAAYVRPAVTGPAAAQMGAYMRRSTPMTMAGLNGTAAQEDMTMGMFN